MTTLTEQARTRVPRRAAVPRSWALRPADIVAVLAANGLLVVAIWVVHGGLDQLGSPAGLSTGLGQVTALVGTFLALVGVVLMARVPWIDHVVGSDSLRAWHRWTGFTCLWLLAAHALLTTIGWVMTGGSDVLAEVIALWTMWDVLLAAVGLALLALVAVSSVRAARRRLQYETWYGLHLYAYLGIALAFLHEVTLGTDLATDPVALGYWVGLYAVTFGLLLGYRVMAPILLSLRHRLRVAHVVPEADGVVSIWVTGRDLDRLAVRAGQWFGVRFLTGAGWWRPHPFSISAAPDGASLRFTIKDLGDDSHRMLTMLVGTRVFLEGPYGAFTAEVVTRPRAVMLAGGIGITPLRAILEDLPPAVRVTLIVRVSRWEDVVFRGELDTLAQARGADVRFLVGRRGTPQMPVDPLAPEWLSRLIPDLRTADVLVCGSSSFTDRVLGTLRTLGVPRGQVHAERFGA